MKKVTLYMEYVAGILNKLPPQFDYDIAAYDNGSGLTIAQDRGSHLYAPQLIGSRIVHIKDPRNAVGAVLDDWDACWKSGKELVKNFVELQNSKRRLYNAK